MALRMRVWLAVWGMAQVAFSRPVRAVLALLESPATVLPAALPSSEEGGRSAAGLTPCCVCGAWVLGCALAWCHQVCQQGLLGVAG